MTVKVKFGPSGEIQEAEGSAEEIAALRQAMKPASVVAPLPVKRNAATGEAKAAAKDRFSEPSVERIKTHILAQPKGRHNVQGVIKDLTGQTMTSRAASLEERTLYGKWLRALKAAREDIKSETGRSFIAKGAAKGQYYIFEDEA